MEERDKNTDIERLLCDHDIEFIKALNIPDKGDIAVSFKKSQIIDILLGDYAKVESLQEYIQNDTLDTITLREFIVYVKKEVLPYLIELLSLDSLEEFIATPVGGVYAYKLYNSPILYPSSSLELFLCHLYRQSLIEAEMHKSVIQAKASLNADSNEISKSVYELIDALSSKSTRVKKKENDNYIAHQTMLAKELGIGEEGVELEGLEELLPHMQPISSMEYKKE